jgi:ketosteroid isomerase-like protein
VGFAPEIEGGGDDDRPRSREEQVVRALFDAIGRGDLDAIRQLLALDITLTIPGSFRLAGVFQGTR